MPIIRVKDIVGMNSKERRKKLSELRTEQSRLRTMISAGGAIENPARIREIRKTIARILTIENQKMRKLESPETQDNAHNDKKKGKPKKPENKPTTAGTKEKKKE